MKDIVLDSNILSDFISIFYENNVNTHGSFEERYRVNRVLANRINLILKTFRENETFEDGVVVVSSFAFVEIARKFEIISNNRFSIEQFKAFIASPPEWFVIASLSDELFPLFNNIPISVLFESESRPIEWTDAIHAATALSRGANCLLATTDSRIMKIQELANRFI